MNPSDKILHQFRVTGATAKTAAQFLWLGFNIKKIRPRGWLLETFHYTKQKQKREQAPSLLLT